MWQNRQNIKKKGRIKYKKNSITCWKKTYPNWINF